MPPVNADKSSSLNKCSLILLFLLTILNTLKLTSISTNRFNFRAWDECLHEVRAGACRWRQITKSSEVASRGSSRTGSAGSIGLYSRTRTHHSHTRLNLDSLTDDLFISLISITPSLFTFRTEPTINLNLVSTSPSTRLEDSTTTTPTGTCTLSLNVLFSLIQTISLVLSKFLFFQIYSLFLLICPQNVLF